MNQPHKMRNEKVWYKRKRRSSQPRQRSFDDFAEEVFRIPKDWAPPKIIFLTDEAEKKFLELARNLPA